MPRMYAADAHGDADRHGRDEASPNAQKTRNMLHQKWPASVGFSLTSPRSLRGSCRTIACGDGRNSGCSQPRLVTSHHKASRTITVTTLITVLGRALGTRTSAASAPALSRGSARGSARRTRRHDRAVVAIGGRASCRLPGRLALLDHRKDFLPQADEIRLGLHLARVAAGEVLARERHVVVACDYPSRPRHITIRWVARNSASSTRVGDEEHLLAGRDPDFSRIAPASTRG